MHNEKSFSPHPMKEACSDVISAVAASWPSSVAPCYANITKPENMLLIAVAVKMQRKDVVIHISRYKVGEGGILRSSTIPDSKFFMGWFL